MDTKIRVSTESRPWKRKFSRCSCRDSNPRPFNHESGALTTELSPCVEVPPRKPPVCSRIDELSKPSTRAFFACYCPVRSGPFCQLDCGNHGANQSVDINLKSTVKTVGFISEVLFAFFVWVWGFLFWVLLFVWFCCCCCLGVGRGWVRRIESNSKRDLWFLYNERLLGGDEKARHSPWAFIWKE